MASRAGFVPRAAVWRTLVDRFEILQKLHFFHLFSTVRRQGIFCGSTSVQTLWKGLHLPGRRDHAVPMYGALCQKVRMMIVDQVYVSYDRFKLVLLPSCNREIRRLTPAEVTRFQDAVRSLKMTEMEGGGSVWDAMRDEYMYRLPIAQVDKSDSDQPLKQFLPCEWAKCLCKLTAGSLVKVWFHLFLRFSKARTKFVKTTKTFCTNSHNFMKDLEYCSFL